MLLMACKACRWLPQAEQGLNIAPLIGAVAAAQGWEWKSRAWGQVHGGKGLPALRPDSASVQMPAGTHAHVDACACRCPQHACAPLPHYQRALCVPWLPQLLEALKRHCSHRKGAWWERHGGLAQSYCTAGRARQPGLSSRGSGVAWPVRPS